MPVAHAVFLTSPLKGGGRYRRAAFVSLLALAFVAPLRAGAQPKPQAALPPDAVARLGQTRLRHADRTTCVVFAPDGKTFLTGGDDGAVRAWSVATGEPVGAVQKPGARVEFLRLTHGGSKVATQFGGAGAIRFLDPATLRETGALTLDNRSRVESSADGKYMVASDAERTATVTELATGLPKLELVGPTVFAFRPDGKALAAADESGTVAVHLLTGGKPTLALKLGAAVTGLAYSPDGSRLAVGTRTAAGTHAIRIFENEGEKPVAEIAGMSLPRQWLGADRLACGNGDAAGVYDLAAKKWRGRVGGVTGEFAVSPDGTKLAATGTGLRVRLYDLATGQQLHAENDSYPDPALLLGSPDGRAMFVLSADTAYHYPLGAGGAKAVGALPGRAVAAAFGGGTLAVATPDAVLVYADFDPFGPFPKSPTHTLKDTAGAKAVAVSPDGKRLAWALDGGKVVASGAGDARRELPVTTTSVLALGFNPAGDRLAVLGREPFLRVWDVTGDEAREVWKARVQRGIKGAIAFSPDGKLMTAASTGQLLVFDAADGKDDIRAPLFQCERYADNGPVHQAAFSPDGKLLVVGASGMYGRVEVWELATRGLARTLSTGYGGTSRLCLFPDGLKAASAGAEEAVTVWDLTFRAGRPAPKPSELLAAVADLSDPKADVGVPAARLLASAGDAGAAQLALALRDSQANDKKLKEYVADLGSDTFRVREAASAALVAQGVRALAAVHAATRSDDPEIRSRAREVMGRLNAKGFYPPDNGLIADKMRLFRAVQALELIGTPAARQVLADIAATDGRPADEAKAALKRLKK